MALAFVGIVGIATGIAVSVGTLRAAAAAQKATELQAREISVLESQTKLLQTQQDEARLSAFPWLEATIDNVAEQFVEGNVVYVAGSTPAWSTEVWARTSSGYFHATLGFMAFANSRPFRATLRLDEHAIDLCPFSEFKKLFGDEVGWVGVTWNGPSYWAGRDARRLLREGNRYVDDRRWRWFDEEAAIDDEAREDMERRQQQAAVATVMSADTTHPGGRLARLLRVRRQPRNDS